VSLRDWFRPSVIALRAYWPAFLAIQGAAVALVFAYFLSPAVQAACTWATDWKTRGGILFAALANILSGGVLPELIKRRTRPPGIPHPSAAELAHQWILFGILGVLVERFYALQSWFFGDGRDPWTLARKIVCDQFGYTLFVALPLVVFWFALREHRYRPLAALRALGFSGLARRVLEIFAGNTAFWIPALVCVYSLPQPLQFLLFLLLNAAWSLLLIFIARRQTGSAAPATP